METSDRRAGRRGEKDTEGGNEQAGEKGEGGEPHAQRGVPVSDGNAFRRGPRTAAAAAAAATGGGARVRGDARGADVCEMS